MPIALAVHGGAGIIRRHSLSPERERACRDVLRAAVDAGAAVLRADGSSVDACLAATAVLEDAPEFNAGRGAVFAADGTQRMDAAVMDGRDRSAGAVAAVQHLRSPVRAAELVRQHSEHILLVGPEAAAFVVEHGAEQADDAWFFTQERWDHLLKARAAGRAAVDHELEDAEVPSDTVGCVALDASGHLAAAVSTGGLGNKHPGRVGDSPLLGAGLWADDGVCAVCSTGVGEALMRSAAAVRIATFMEAAGLDLEAAARRVILEETPRFGGFGGVIAVDAAGRIAMPFGSGGMYRAALHADGRVEVAIW